MHTIPVGVLISYLLLLLDVAWTVSRRLTRELLRMSLYRVRVEYLHHLAEVDALHQFVDLFIVVVVAEHEQNCFDVPRLCQAYNQVAQVDDACMHLQQHMTRLNDTCLAVSAPDMLPLLAYKAIQCHVGEIHYDAVSTETTLLDDQISN